MLSKITRGKKPNWDSGTNYQIASLKTTKTASELWQYCPEIAALTMVSVVENPLQI